MSLLLQVIGISVGAAMGALMRWLLSSAFNTPSATLAWGTFLANALGCYLIGVAMAAFDDSSPMHALLRLVVVTGFLGSLTTFSTFAAEVVSAAQQGRWASALLIVASHLCIALLLTYLGLLSVTAVRAINR